jgi:hypothetical protein
MADIERYGCNPPQAHVLLPDGKFVLYEAAAQWAKAEYIRGLRDAWDTVRLIHGIEEHLCASEEECYTIDAALGRIAKLFPCAQCGGVGSGCTCEKELV